MRSAGTKYEELCDGLRQEILSKLRPGDSLDSERTLVERFGVSRVTVRRALDQLDAAGLIVRVHGSGTYVSDSQLIGKTLRLTSFTDDMRERGLEAGSVVSTSDVIHADTALATVLKLRTRCRCAEAAPPQARQQDTDGALKSPSFRLVSFRGSKSGT